MTTTRTFGRRPTLGEMKVYYAREDVLAFLYEECQIRNVLAAFRKNTWPIHPTSKEHLRTIIDKTIKDKIEKAYRNVSDSIDTVRLEMFDYLSFHSATTITVGEQVIGFDLIFEADEQGWRKSFEALDGIIKVLDDFEVCSLRSPTPSAYGYRMKYSGVRSLHLMIPFEALPKELNGKPILGQREKIYSQIRTYFQRHCGMGHVESPKIIRLAYSLNEDNGLVSVPITRDELPFFQPWEANIGNVTVNKPWHGTTENRVKEIMEEGFKPQKESGGKIWFTRNSSEAYWIAKRRSEERGETPVVFCCEIDLGEYSKFETHRTIYVFQYASIAKDVIRRVSRLEFNKDIASKVRSNDDTPVGEFSLETWAQRLKSKEQAVRVEAAWHLMKAKEAVPTESLKQGLCDVNPDVRWYLTEALQKHLSPEAIQLAIKMLSDDDLFVRASAIDTLVLASENPLNALWDTVTSDIASFSKESFSSVMSTIHQICGGDVSKIIESFVEFGGSRRIAHALQKAIESGQPSVLARGYIRELRKLSGLVEGSEFFSEATKLLVHQLLRRLSEENANLDFVSILQEIWQDEAVLFWTIHEFATPFDIKLGKLPKNRMPTKEGEFLQSAIKDATLELSLQQKARILTAFLLRCSSQLIAEQSALVCLRLSKR